MPSNYQQSVEYMKSIENFKIQYVPTERKQEILPDCKAKLIYNFKTHTHTLVTTKEDLEENLIKTAEQLKIILEAETIDDIPSK